MVLSPLFGYSFIFVQHQTLLFCSVAYLADNASGEDEGDEKTGRRDDFQCLLLPDGWSRQLAQVRVAAVVRYSR